MSANRTTPVKVLPLIPQVETGFDPAPFIAQAHRLVETHLVSTLLLTDEAVLADIELWLAAHIATVIVPVLASESGTGVSGTAARGPLGRGLASTPAGQMCQALDSTGRLTEVMLGSTPFVFEAFGT